MTQVASNDSIMINYIGNWMYDTHFFENKLLNEKLVELFNIHSRNNQAFNVTMSGMKRSKRLVISFSKDDEAEALLEDDKRYDVICRIINRMFGKNEETEVDGVEMTKTEYVQHEPINVLFYQDEVFVLEQRYISKNLIRILELEKKWQTEVEENQE
jgi:hypothetical protein